jgi:hypothetical protein
LIGWSFSPARIRYDIGAYEYGEDLNKLLYRFLLRLQFPVVNSNSPTPTPLNIFSIQGDITGPSGIPDNKVDNYDFNQLVNDFGKLELQDLSNRASFKTGSRYI